MPDPAAMPIRRLSWFHWLTASLVVIPCCFPVYSPFVFQVVLHLWLGHLSSIPGREKLSVPEVTLVPWAIVYVAQIIVLGVPMAMAALTLPRRPRLGWQFSLAVVGIQALVLLGNLVAFTLWGKTAWKPLGAEVTAVLFLTEVALLIANVALLWDAAKALAADPL